MTKEELKKYQSVWTVTQRQLNNQYKSIDNQLKQLSAFINELKEKMEWESKTPLEKKQILLRKKKDKLEEDFK